MLRSRAARLGRLCLDSNIKYAPELSACEQGFSCRCLSTALSQPSFSSDQYSSSHSSTNASCQPSLGFAARGFGSKGSTSDDNTATVKTYDEDGLFPEESAPPVAESSGGEIFSPDAITAAAETSALAEAWDEAWIINKAFQYLIQWTHDATGTTWWQSIAMCTLVARIAMIPLVVKQMGNMDRMKKAKPEMEAVVEWYNQKKDLGLAKEYQQEYTERLAGVWKKYDCNPIKSMLPLFGQAPLFIGFFGALRSMAGAQVPSLAAGGPSPPLLYEWFPSLQPGLWSDLTIADPYYTLPVLSASIFMLAVKLNAADGMQGQDDKTLARMKKFMYGIGVVIIPFTASMPQSVFCYWITSNIYSLAQSAVFRFRGVRRVLGLPSLVAAKQSKAANVEAVVKAAEAAGKPVKTYSTPPNRHTPAAPASARERPRPNGKPVVSDTPPKRTSAVKGPAEEDKRGGRRGKSGAPKKAGTGGIRPWNS